jgi:imidazolonepropionase-like amidohydrolase
MGLRLMIDLDRRKVVAAGIFSGGLALAQGAQAFQAELPAETLFRNVRVFSGRSTRLSGVTDVLVRGNKIAAVGDGLASAGRTIEGRERTLIPGLIDVHAHLEFYNLPALDFSSADPDYLQVRQAAAAEDFLMTGFTSVRDAGGPTFGLKRAIDERLMRGPRIWPSGAILSQTSGHAESRPINALPSPKNRELTPHERARYLAVVDGVPEVLEKVREQLFQGASQVKLAVGGGVSSNFDPLDVTQFSPEEIRAAVGAAEDWGTYVMVHGYTPRAINRAIDCGVKCIEHGQLLDEATLRRMGNENIWLSLQPFLQDEDAIPTAPGSANERKYQQVTEGTDRAYSLAKRLGLKVAFGTDIQLNPNGAARQSHYLPKLLRWYSGGEALKMATHDNAALLAMSGPRTPYAGQLGVIEQDALADVLLVNGDPVADLNLLADPANNLAIIMKDGMIFKDVA